MIKTTLITIGVLIVCGLETLGHYFGFCFHGWLSLMMGGISTHVNGILLYMSQFKIWLGSRETKTRHKCKDHKEHSHEVQT